MVAVISVDAYPFLPSQTWPVTLLEDTGIGVFWLDCAS